MIQCQVSRVHDFVPQIRFACAGLCRPGSEMQKEFTDATETFVAVVCSLHPVSWACSHVWRDMQTLEGYTNPYYRRRGLQRFAATGLIAAGHLDIRQVVAVFSPDCVGLTRSLGFVEVKLFRRADSDWIEVPL